MHVPNLASVLSTAILLLPWLVLGAPATINKQGVASGPGNQFLGTLTWYPQQPALLLASISNNSTSHYAILTKNNLLDDSHPYSPLIVKSLSGRPVALQGTRYPYPNIEDAQFRDFPPGSSWERYFNMSDYMPPSNAIKIPESQCFSFQLPGFVEALAIDDTDKSQHLADIFLSRGITNVEVVSNPIHMNVTIGPTPPGTPTTQALGAVVPIPSEPAGVFIPPGGGVAVDVLQNSLQEGFVIGPGARKPVTK
ncbi:MAG: hypothetical protein Q9182_003569 [Xanthomendoza sp. 2 TL-2023]